MEEASQSLEFFRGWVGVVSTVARGLEPGAKGGTLTTRPLPSSARGCPHDIRRASACEEGDVLSERLYLCQGSRALNTRAGCTVV